ncbi:aminotransferase class I/II-fold pyridoxal phosphate-dependent enzyme [Roseicyclus sp. F158]|uniref:Aminotransferase n=1 Tax=Tropicimonas omnivorans TaxID=3075590 RepID=A0ABU3DIX1_9RHOB|nr:aminotransferase class I/II-fold pyridoxal phosphate-dependent enzyme [Roseicyclus sp. F158]MDT0683671.1 aminotransferase class I/II-fold pyridoxal phosphate-dependent enzyme [Roseicyclus sp. F158]
MRRSARGDVDPFIVMDVMERARAAEAAGRRIVHMEVGQPGTGAPKGARDAVAAAMEAGPLGYTVALGLPELRARIARLYAQWYGIDLDPARVIVTPGASGAFILAFTALFEAGEKVGLGLPGYPSYRQILRALSLQPVGLPTAPEARYQPVPDDVPPGLAGLILASPSNPSGTMLDRVALGALAERCRETGTALIADEIYHGIQYEGRAISALEVDPDAIIVNSFSKYFSMTGWRIGWLVVPEAEVRRYERLAQNLFICTTHASQVAALAAMDCTEELDRNVGVYAANRALLLEGLPKAGFTDFAPPDGAFYVYAGLDGISEDSLAFAGEVLDRAGVAVTPGLDFDPARGRRTLRFSYARSTADITEGLERLTEFMSRR